MIRKDYAPKLFGRLLRSFEKVPRPPGRRTFRNSFFYILPGALNVVLCTADFRLCNLNRRADTRHDFFLKNLTRFRLYTRIGRSTFCRHPECAPKERHIGNGS